MKIEIAATLLALSMGAAPAMATTETPPDTPATAEAQPAFDRAAWVALAGKADQSGPRADLLDAAIAEVPAGASASQVAERLGEPDRRFDKAWAYMAGPTIFGGEYVALLVRFDDQDRVVDARRVNSETWQ